MRKKEKKSYKTQKRQRKQTTVRQYQAQLCSILVPVPPSAVLCPWQKTSSVKQSSLLANAMLDLGNRPIAQKFTKANGEESEVPTPAVSNTTLKRRHRTAVPNSLRQSKSCLALAFCAVHALGLHGTFTFKCKIPMIAYRVCQWPVAFPAWE